MATEKQQETWRAVLTSGETKAVRVTFYDEDHEGGDIVAACDGRDANAAPPRLAVLLLAAEHGWSVREILAPGDLSAEERERAAFRRGAEAMREAAAKACEVVAVGSRIDREYATACECAVDIRVLPLPGVPS